MVRPLLPNLLPSRRVGTAPQPAQSTGSTGGAQGDFAYSLFTAPRRSVAYMVDFGRKQLGWDAKPDAQPAQHTVFELWAAQRAAAGMASPLVTPAASAICSPAKPASEAGSDGAAKDGTASPASVLHAPLTDVAAQVSRRLLEAEPLLPAAPSHSSEAAHSEAASHSALSVTGSVVSHPIEPVAAAAAPAAEPQPARSHANPAAKLALRAALALVPIAAAAGVANMAGGRSGAGRERRSGRRAERSPSPASRRVDSRRFGHPREVPYSRPKPGAVVVA